MNIILISLDTLRASRLSGYGYAKPTSPHLDRIAAEGVLFERCYAGDIPTEVAHTGVFTGKIGLTTGVVSHGSKLVRLRRSVPWMPARLCSAGFKTSAVDNLYLLQEWFARGYQHYTNSGHFVRWIDGETVNQLALPWLEAHKDESFFLFLHYWDAHTPYVPPDAYIPEFYDSSRDPFDPGNRSMEPAYDHPTYPLLKEHLYDAAGYVTDCDYYEALYDAEIRYLDDCLKELDDHLDRLGIRDDTLLVLFGDHGESLTEHDTYWMHSGLYESTVHVPLILRWPGRIPAGRRVRGFVQHTDIMPTILEAARSDPAPGIRVDALADPEGMDGRSLWASIMGTEDGIHDRIYLSECSWQAARGIRTERYKYIRTYDSGLFGRPPTELFDLVADPGEVVNLVEREPAIASAFDNELTGWVTARLNGGDDPMERQLREAGLPSNRRVEHLVTSTGMTWEEWCREPSRHRFDRALKRARHEEAFRQLVAQLRSEG